MTRVWAGSGILFIVLFAAGLVFANVVASPSYPGIEEPTRTIQAYFAENGAEVRALVFCHAVAALGLLLFAGYLVAVLTGAGASGALAALALAGGALASAFLLLSVLPMWALAHAGSGAERGVVRTLHDLTYLVGGVAFLLAAAVLVASASLAAVPRRLLPRWTGWVAMTAAALAVLSSPALLFENFGPPFLLALLAMAMTLLWIFASSVVLVLRAPAHSATASPTVSTWPRSRPTHGLGLAGREASAPRSDR